MSSFDFLVASGGQPEPRWRVLVIKDETRRSGVRTKLVWGTVAVVGAVLAVGLLLWPKPGWSGDAIITAIHPDGTVEYDEARFVKAEENNSVAEPIPDRHHTAVLGDQVAIFTAVGDWCAATVGLGLENGVGTNPCTRAEFLAITHERLYAVRLKVDGDGKITEIAEYYHP